MFKNRYHTEKTKKKMSENHKGNKNPMFGKKRSEETRKKVSNAIKGNKHPLFGKSPSKETRIKMSITSKGKHYSPNTEFKKGMIPSWVRREGKKLTEEHKRKISIALKGRNLGDKNSMKRPDVLRKWFQTNRIKPNNAEIKLQFILNEIQINNWEFVGNGEVILGGFCPDFINVNGKKLIIELFGNYWHTKKEMKERDKKRIKTYESFGYKTLIIWEHELKNKEQLKMRLLNFCGDKEC